MKVLVGIDIGGTKTAVILGRLGEGESASIVERAEFPTEAAGGWQPAVRRLLDTARRLLAEHDLTAADVGGAGISCGGPLDSARGLLLSPPNLPGWDRVPIVAQIEDGIGVPARLMNDANACAVAEWRFGAGQGCRSMVFLTFGTGMGAGLLLDGRLYEGACDLAGEVGHVRLAEDGPEGYGKRGSFEGFCSGGGIARLAREEAARRFARGEAVAFCPTAGDLEAITTQRVAEAATAGDGTARAIFEASGRWLGRGIAMLIDILNPERIVIGSIYARCRPFLEPAMRAVISQEALAAAAAACTIVPAGLGERIGDYASLAVAQAAAGGAA